MVNTTTAPSNSKTGYISESVCKPKCRPKQTNTHTQQMGLKTAIYGLTSIQLLTAADVNKMDINMLLILANKLTDL